MLNPFLSEEDLLKRILQDFGVVSREEIKGGRLAGVTKQELIDTLYDFLLGLIPLKASAVLIIDEAQNLPLPVLEQIRILSNLETDKEKLLQIILVGQLNLQTLLRSPEMRQLDQRVSIRYRARSRSIARRVAGYVAHRLRLPADRRRSRFAPKALDAGAPPVGRHPAPHQSDLRSRAAGGVFGPRQPHHAGMVDARGREPRPARGSACVARLVSGGASICRGAVVAAGVGCRRRLGARYLYERFADRRRRGRERCAPASVPRGDCRRRSRQPTADADDASPDRFSSVPMPLPVARRERPADDRLARDVRLFGVYYAEVDLGIARPLAARACRGVHLIAGGAPRRERRRAVARRACVRSRRASAIGMAPCVRHDARLGVAHRTMSLILDALRRRSSRPQTPTERRRRRARRRRARDARLSATSGGRPVAAQRLLLYGARGRGDRLCRPVAADRVARAARAAATGAGARAAAGGRDAPAPQRRRLRVAALIGRRLPAAGVAACAVGRRPGRQRSAGNAVRADARADPTRRPAPPAPLRSRRRLRRDRRRCGRATLGRACDRVATCAVARRRRARPSGAARTPRPAASAQPPATIISGSRSTTSASAISRTRSCTTARCSSATTSSAEVHNNLGLLYQDQGQLDDAIEGVSAGDRASIPSTSRAHNNLGVALMRVGPLDGAAAEFRVALAADPRNVESLVNLALAQKAAGRAADARDLLRRAVGIDPRNAGAHYNLAVVADEAGDAAMAVEHYRAFLKLRRRHARRARRPGPRAARRTGRVAPPPAWSFPASLGHIPGMTDRPNARRDSTTSFAKTAVSAFRRIPRQARSSRTNSIYAEAERDPEAFWARFAGELEWSPPWDTVLDWQPPHAKWFVGGKLNASVNCLDRHVRGPRRNKAAIIWEGEPGDRRTLTYFDLLSRGLGVRERAEVARREEGRSRRASTCRSFPSSPIAMLACARIGAVHSVVFGGFSAESLRDRINDAQARAAHHRRRRLPPRADRAAQAGRRRGARRHAVDRARRRRRSAAGAAMPVHDARRGAITGTTS